MNIGDEIYFSPNYRMIDMDISNKEQVLLAFEERMKEYYFKPLSQLNHNKHAFAAGMIIVSLVDIFARYEANCGGVGDRYKNWLQQNLKAISNNHNKETMARIIYDRYRCGLLHEGHLKKNGEFSYEINKSFFLKRVSGGIIIVMNPRLMQQELEEYFKNYILELNTNEQVYNIFKQNFDIDFKDEIEVFKSTRDVKHQSRVHVACN